MSEHVVVAEWLRRQTRNLLGFSRAGSNPADYDQKKEFGRGFWFLNKFFYEILTKTFYYSDICNHLYRVMPSSSLLFGWEDIDCEE